MRYVVLLLNVAVAFASECVIQLTVVGEVHDFKNDDRHVQEFRSSQYARAARGDLILGLEGLIAERSPTAESRLRDMIPNFHPVASTVYGIENEFAHVLIDLLRARLQTTPKRLEIAVGALVSTESGKAALRSSPKGTLGLMNLMSPKPVTPHLYLEDMIQTFLRLSESPSHAAAVREYPQLRERVRRALDAVDPDPELHRIALEWRDALFTQKILELYELGRQKKKDVLIIVGKAHVSGLSERLRAHKIYPRLIVQNEKYGAFVELKAEDPG